MFLKLVQTHNWFINHKNIIGRAFLYTYIFLGILLFCSMFLELLFGSLHNKEVILLIILLSGSIVSSSYILGTLVIKLSNWFNKHYHQAEQKVKLN